MGLKTLCLMQLKDKLDFSYLRNTKQTIFKIVLGLLKFVLLTVAIYIGFAILIALKLVSILPGIPTNFISVIVTIMLILSIIVCSFGLVKTLYLAKDNFVLLTFPVSRTVVFLSKLIVYYVYELKKNLYYFLPLFVAFGVINKLPFYYYFWIIFALFVITLIIITISALLSIPLLYLENFVSSYKWIEYSLLVICIAGVSIGLILIINSIPANLDLIGTWGTTFWKVQSFLNDFNQIMMPFTYITISIVGTRYGVVNSFLSGSQILTMFIILSIVAIVLCLIFVCVRPLYFHMASTPFEFRKRQAKKEYKNITKKPFWSTVKKDLIITYRTPEKFYSLILVAIGLPLAIFLLNKIYSAMDTRLSGSYMVVAFNILIILLIVLSSNVNISHIYSEDGSANYLLKTSPRTRVKLLLSRLFLNFVSVTFSIIITTFIFTTFVKIGFINSLLIFGFIESIYIAHLIWSAELDLMNPQIQRYQTEGLHLNNPNDIKSTIYAFLLSIIFAFATYFLIAENERIIWLKLFVIALAFVILKVWIFISKVNVYFEEKLS